MVALTQLDPNVWGCMKVFQVLCGLAEVKPSADLFSYLYQVMRTKKKDMIPEGAGNEGDPSTSRWEEAKS